MSLSTWTERAKRSGEAEMFEHLLPSRRRFLQEAGLGFGSLALADLLHRDACAAPVTGFCTTSGKCLKSPFAWKQHGDSGTWGSDLIPHLSRHVDKMCFLHSMYLRQNNHAPASIELMCGTNRPGLPALGAWMTYGLGSQNQNLPSYVVLHDTRPRGDDQIWSAGFLPKSYQALALDARRKEAIDNLARDPKHSDDQQRAQLELLRQLN